MNAAAKSLRFMKNRSKTIRNWRITCHHYVTALPSSAQTGSQVARKVLQGQEWQWRVHCLLIKWFLLILINSSLKWNTNYIILEAADSLLFLNRFFIVFKHPFSPLTFPLLSIKYVLFLESKNISEGLSWLLSS